MTVAQERYRFGSEDGTESTHGFLAALNTAITRDATDASTFILRISIQAVATGQANLDAQLQRSINGGAFADVTTTSTHVKAVTTAVFANNEHSTNRLGGTGSFDASNQGCSHDGVAGGNQMDIITNGSAECVYSVQLVPADFAGGEVITFQILADGSPMSGGYTVTPTINIETAAVNFTANTLTGALAVTSHLAKLPGPSAIAAVNTDAEIDADTIFLLRFRVENTGGDGATGFKLRRSHNGGGYVDVTTTSAVAEAVAASGFSDGDDVPEVLGGSGTYIADNNAGSEDGGFTLTANFPASGAVEPVFAVRIIAADVADTDTVAFRVYNGDDTPLVGYTVTPTITVNIAAGDVTATPTAGAIVVTGLAPTVSAAILAEPTAGSIVLSGLAPTVAASSTVSPTVSALAIAGFAPTVTADALVVPATSALEFTGLAPTVVADAALEPSLSALVISGFAPSVDAGASVSVTPELGVLELTALAPTLAAGAVLSPDGATLEIAGLAPTLSTSASVEPGVAALEITGFAPTVEAAGNVTVVPTVGSLEIAGLAPTLSIQQQPTPAGELNEDIELTVDTTYLIWARVENTGVEGGTGFRWSYNHESVGWLPVAVTIPEEEWSDETLWSDGTGWLEEEPNKIIAVNASSFANDDDVPERLTGSGTYLTDNNAATEDGTTTIAANFPAGGAVEFVLSFRVVGLLVQNGQTGQIRLELGDGTDLNAYTEIFTYTVSGSGAVIADPATAILQLVGFAPSVVAHASVIPELPPNLDIIGFAPTAAISHSVEPSLGVIEISGLAPDASAGFTAEPSAGTIELTGAAPDAWGGTNELLAPDEILAASNLQDTNLASPPVRLADIDEPVDSDDGEWWTLVGQVEDTQATLAFPFSSGPLSGPQKLRVRVRKTTGAATPQVRIELWYAGGIAPIAQITTDVTSDVGQVVELAFNADDLPDQDGDGVQIKFFGLAA